MNKRKLLAVLGAMVLTFGVAGTAFAEDLKDAHMGLTVSWDAEGNPVIEDSEGADVTDQFLETDASKCEGITGTEIGWHFVQSPTDANSGNLTADFDSDPTYGPRPADGNQGAQLDWDVVTDGGDAGDTLNDATTDADGGELRVSHICVGTNESEPTDTPAAPTPTAPSFTDEPGGDTDAPSEPNTAAIGGNGTSGPADGAWLLVVALGVLLASIVVLTPARAKSRR